MPLDGRLRETFDRVAISVEPDVERGLQRTIDRIAGRREGSSLTWLVAVGAVVLVIVIIVRGSPGLAPDGVGGSVPRSAGPTGTTTAGAEPFDAIAGTYSVTLAGADPGVAELGLAGRWSMTLHPTGAIDLVPPPDFEGSRAAGHTFSLDAGSLRTDLYYNDYCDSVGTYRWSLADDGLALTPVDDSCAIRRTLLGTQAWSVSP